MCRTLLIFPVFVFFLQACTSGKEMVKDNDIKPSGEDFIYWEDVSSLYQMTDACATIQPLKYKVLKIDYPGLTKRLDTNLKEKTDTLIFPVYLPDGIIEHYNLTKTSVMAPELEQKYKHIKTYSGSGVENPADQIRMDLAPKGLSIMVLSSRGTMLIQPYCDQDSSHVLSFYKKDLPPDIKEQFEK